MLIAKLAIAAVIVLLAAGRAGAQAFEEPDLSRPVPGWLMTPSVAIGATFDDNPVLAAEGNPTPNDTITSVAPALDLTFRGRHTLVGLGYNGSLVRYRTLDELDSFDQGARAEVRHQASERVGLQFRNYFSDSPTTDTLQIGGLPFVRTGTRQNEFIGGTTIQATKRLELTGSYRFQWLEFDRPASLTDPLLQGGKSHGVTLGALQAVSSRVRVGGSYTYQHAIVGENLQGFDIQNGEGTIAVQLSPTLSLDAGAGVSHVALPEDLGSRTGPAGHIGLRKRTEHALFTLSAARSFVPGFGFGASRQNSEISGSVRLPFANTRGFVQGRLAWRDSDSIFRSELTGGDPLFDDQLDVSSVWLITTVGYAVQRWLRVEAFYSGAFQDTPVAGGRVDRNRVGVQVVTLRPMRIQ